jgi:hypothetical protein
MTMTAYNDLFPRSSDPIVTLCLERKEGKLPKGDYSFFEYYCTDKGCDCRRVTLCVIERTKKREMAVISMGFDLDDDFSGPYLDDMHPQSPGAQQLLEMFVSGLNLNPPFLELLYRHYREMRGKVDGRNYRGKPFPDPAKTKRIICNAPTIEEFLANKMADKPDKVVQQLPKKGSGAAASKGTDSALRCLAERYNACKDRDRQQLQNALRDWMLHEPDFARQLSDLLLEYAAAYRDGDLLIEGTMLILLDALEIIRVELERRRPRSEEINRQLQEALAQRIFLEAAPSNLNLAVAHLLLDSRLELLPVLREANTQRLLLDGPPLHEQHSAEDAVTHLFKGIEELHGSCPFETMEQLLDMIALQPVESQLGMIEQMLLAPSPLIRDTAALMLMHPEAVVREETAAMLAHYADRISPETLRRLIVSRNWFPEEIRTWIDRAISTARKARIECATLVQSDKPTVYVSVVDGAFAQSLQVLLPEGKEFVSCSMLLKRGQGVADAFLIPLPTKRERDRFVKVLVDQTGAAECDMAYLDQRVCHTLAEGASLGKPPFYRLLQIAERLGKDNWKGIPFDAVQELETVQAELAQTAPQTLTAAARKRSLDQSEDWLFDHTFASSWFEDDHDLDQAVHDAIQRCRKASSFETQATKAVLKLLEQRREIWRDRLTLTTLWLRACRKPPLPWQQMFHVAEAVADTAKPVSTIPLMQSIAYHSLGACLSRQGA